jgi:tyrosine aminotransferase
MSYEEIVPTFAELVKEEEKSSVIIFKCSGLTKRYLGPGWRMGWVIVYSSEEVRSYYRGLLRGILNVILMPNTVMQTSIP